MYNKKLSLSLRKHRWKSIVHRMWWCWVLIWHHKRDHKRKPWQIRLFRIKNFSSTKHSAKRMKTSHRWGETVFKSHNQLKANTQKIIFWIYIKNSQNSEIRKQSKCRNGQKIWTSTSLQIYLCQIRGLQGSQHHVIRKMYIKINMRNQCLPIRRLLKQGNNEADNSKDVLEQEISSAAGENANF